MTRLGGEPDIRAVSALMRSWALLGAGLDRLLLEDRGYRVLADHLRDELYVFVPVDQADDFTGLPGVRVLSRGHQLLVPRTPDHSSQVADWVGTPGETLALVDRRRLAERLQDLAPALYEPVAP